MFRAIGTYLKMNEGDYGEIITFNLIEGNILSLDNITFVVENIKTKEKILEKDCHFVDSTSFEVQLSKEDSDKLPKGNYLWGILQERDGELIDTLTIDNKLVVERGLSDES